MKASLKLALRALCFTLCMLCLTLGSLPLFAAERTIRVGYVDYQGFISKGANGEYVGYGAEYLSDIARYTGWRYKYIYGTWTEQLKNLREGRIDLLCHAQITPERKKDFLFSANPDGIEENLLYVRNGDKRYYYNDFIHFNGMKVGLTSDCIHSDRFIAYAAKHGFSFKPVFFDSSVKSFKALDRGKLDAVAAGSVTVAAGYKIVARISSDPFYFMAGKKSQWLVNQIDSAMTEIQSINPYYSQKLYKRYYYDVASFSSISLTRDDAKFISQCPPITVAFIPDRYPSSALDRNGHAIGVLTDIFKFISKGSGLKFNFIVLPKLEKPKDYLSSHPDSIVAGVLLKNPALMTSDFTLSKSIFTGSIVLVCKRGRTYDLGGKTKSRVAVPKNYQGLQKELPRLYPSFEIAVFATADACLRAVQSGKADFAAQNIDVLASMLQNPRYSDLKILTTNIMEEPIAAVARTSERNKRLINIIDRCTVLFNEKELRQILVGYAAKNTYEPTFYDICYKYRWPFASIIVLLAAAAAVMLRYRTLKARYYRSIQAANARLEKAVERANIANAAKSSFLAKMSHDMRTPMNGILGIAYLSRDKDDPALLHKDIDQIEQSGTMLLNIINDTLDMSRIESGKMELHPTACVGSNLFNSVIAILQPQIKAKDISLTVSTSGFDDTAVYVDCSRFNQVFINLLSNSIKFTNPGGHIVLAAKRIEKRKDTVVDQFTVKDDGIGMSEEFQKRMFTPFEQEKRMDNAMQGTGLGLAIVRSIISLMGGSISVKSAENVGTEFTITLTAPLAHDAAADKHNSSEHVLYDGLAGRRILLCEDNKINEIVAVKLLEKAGCLVECAVNGKEGVDKFAASAPQHFSAILMDIRMPVMDGLEAAKAIRAMKRSDAATIPIIAMSANAFEDDIRKSLSAGMNAYLPKPVIPSEFYKTLIIAVHENSQMLNKK